MLEGDYDQAVDYFTSALNFRPGLMHALVSRGYCYLTLGEEDKAQKDFAEVIARDACFNRNIYVLVALCLKRTGDYPQAIRYLSRCIAQFSAFKPALIARGELQLKVRDYEKARMDFRQVLQQDGAHVVARRGLGDALRGLGNFREALRQYARAIEEAVAMLRRSLCEGGDGAAAAGGPRRTRGTGRRRRSPTTGGASPGRPRRAPARRTARRGSSARVSRRRTTRSCGGSRAPRRASRARWRSRSATRSR